MKKVLLVILAFIIASLCIYLFTLNDRSEPQGCTATINMYYPEHRAHLTLDVVAIDSSKTGVMTLGGYVIKDNIRKNVRRDIYFSWENHEDNYRLVSDHIKTVVAIDNVDEGVLDKILPPFFVYKDKKIFFTIKHQINGGYMFSIQERPVFFCSQ